MKMNIASKIGTAGVIALTAGLMAAPAASAQEAGFLAEFERPYGFAPGEESQPLDARTRDTAGNRVIVNGRILNDTSTLNGGLNTGWGQTSGASGLLGNSSAIGNQLNVVTNGSFNTVIIDSTQINNGDQTVYLNGELDLND